MKLKTIRLIIVSLMLVLCTNINAFAGDTDGEMSYEAKTVCDLGFMFYDQNNSFAGDEVVTRGEFAVYLSRLLNVGDFDAEDTDEAIELMCDMKYMRRMNDTHLSPESYISRNQAICFIMNALGYGPLVRGDNYPDNYISYANVLGLTVNCDNENAMTKEEVARLFYASFEVPYCVKGYSGGYITHETNPDITILTEIHDIYKDKGIVTNNGISSLYDASDNIGAQRVVIGTRSLGTGTTNVSDYFGYRVEYYYHKDDHDETVVSVRPGKNEEIIIESSMLDVDDLTGGTKEISYYTNNGGKKTARIASDAAVIYNGEAYSGFTAQTLRPVNGKVVLVSNTNSSEYNVVLVYDYKNYAVKNLDLELYEIEDKFGRELLLDPNDKTRKIKVTSSEGKSLFVVDIQIDDIIMVAESISGDYVDVITCKDYVEGSIGSVNTVGKDTLININGTEYTVDREYISAVHINKYELFVGFSGKFYLDASGRVAYVELINTDKIKAAYLMTAYKLAGNEDILGLRLFTEEGKVVSYECATKVTVDSKSSKKGTELYTLLCPGGITEKQLIRFKVNKDNKISSIDLPYETSPQKGEPKASLHYDHKSTGGLFYRKTGNVFAGKVFANASTKIFKVPPKGSASNDLRYYRVMPVSELTDQTSYAIDALSVQGTSFVSEYIIYYSPAGDETIEKKQRYTLIDKIVQTVNSDDEIVYKITGMRAGSKVEYETFDSEIITSQDITDGKIGEGDVVQLRVLDGKITNYNLIYDYSEGNKGWKNGTNPSATSYTTDIFSVYGSVRERRGSIIDVVAGTDFEDETAYSAKFNVSAYSVMVYDPNERENKVYKGTYEDIMDYVNNGSEFSEVVVFQEWGEGRDMFVYLK